ncbi:hypothetical protein GDO78_012551 [Eleutherodactylus coqui]|uniref:Uncharacterized protein n=1 Tax=Eleutherodactylus coqui TaxID=57060 RepID=A0A8J6K4J2_ELECQ|nr:hypothetical protein GDO78_012551 [Eleutherodactylus coqui]
MYHNPCLITTKQNKNRNEKRIKTTWEMDQYHLNLLSENHRTVKTKGPTTESLSLLLLDTARVITVLLKSMVPHFQRHVRISKY